MENECAGVGCCNTLIFRGESYKSETLNKLDWLAVVVDTGGTVGIRGTFPSQKTWGKRTCSAVGRLENGKRLGFP